MGAFDKDYFEDEYLLTRINIGVSIVIMLMSITILIKMCCGAKHQFFIGIIVLQLTGCVLVEISETSGIIAVDAGNDFHKTERPMG